MTSYRSTAPTLLGRGLFVTGLLLVGAVACSHSASGFDEGMESGDASGESTGDAGASDVAHDALADAPSLTLGTPDGASGVDAHPSAPCNNAANVDGDHDGFTGAQGDCDDCDPNVNPGAYDVPGNGVDEDCDGKADDEPSGCDTGLAVDSASALDAVKSLDVCRQQSGQSWGVVSAAWVFPDGTSASLRPPALDCPVTGPPNPSSHGLLGSFGPDLTPRAGSSMLAVSSGVARAGANAVPSPGMGTSPDSGQMCTYSAAPAGFPVSSASCPGVVATAGDVFDGMALELKIKVPTNASALSFDFDFYSTEFPFYVCSSDGYNDTFASLLWSSASGTPADHDVAVDSSGDAVTVNNSFMQVCVPQTVLNLTSVTYACPLGSGQLQGTGFSEVMGGENGTTYTQGGATGWLTTQAGVVPGETITLRFAIWDAGDDIHDSTALIDHFGWSLSAGQAPPAMAASGPPATTRPPP